MARAHPESNRDQNQQEYLYINKEDFVKALAITAPITIIGSTAEIINALQTSAPFAEYIAIPTNWLAKAGYALTAAETAKHALNYCKMTPQQKDAQQTFISNLMYATGITQIASFTAAYFAAGNWKQFINAGTTQAYNAKVAILGGVALGMLDQILFGKAKRAGDEPQEHINPEARNPHAEQVRRRRCNQESEPQRQHSF